MNHVFERKTKQFMMGLLLLMLFAVVIPTPLNARAAETTTETEGDDGQNLDINNFHVEMDNNGNLTSNIDNQGDSTKTWNVIFNKYKVFAIGFSGIGTITFVILLILNCMKLGANSDNPNGRRSAVSGILWTAIAAAGCGSATVLTALFWNAFK